ncbi:sigma-70 family RNA polymerase sigma factor [Klenkia sp. PcliD-1-E]|uniref:sigma-70 family RNA polymerase sigma factor n=1 Tax=Klenkia sp. PcliD-1-E TaxID=2954492 RepID=UPI002096E27D|nr:sigma-70 family RNA polymerase sigma factor [Klenkia sp. PcliD-1-E]MCO7221181.1 sigma-70 family RNA polymerase sigma factor [Klenkia sp. PcliD-1-E]
MSAHGRAAGDLGLEAGQVDAAELLGTRPRPTPRPRAAAPAPRRPVGGETARPTSHRRPEPAPVEVAGPAHVEAVDAEEVGAEEVDAEEVDAVELAAGLWPEGEEQVAVWTLVERAQAGEAEAFGDLYDRYADMVFRYLYHRVPDRQTAEDFTSETFVRALRRIDSLSFQGRDVGAWLVTIARNIVRDHVKSSRFRLEVATADMRDADRATDGPEDAVLQGLTNEQLLACVAQLGDEQRECIALRFLQGLSVAETAAAMGKKDGAIKALQHRAVKRLAALLPEGLR